MTQGQLLPMTEAEYQSRIVDSARLLGWRIHHCRPLARAGGSFHTPITGHAGFPDLVLVRQRDGRLLLLEVKSEDGRLTNEQREWMRAWQQVPCAEVYVARPSNWDFIWRLLQ